MCRWFPGRGCKLIWLVVDWSAAGGAADHLVWGGGWNTRGSRGDIFHPLHGSVLSMSRSAASAAFRLVGLVGESLVSGQKPQPLSHML